MAVAESGVELGPNAGLLRARSRLFYFFRLTMAGMELPQLMVTFTVTLPKTTSINLICFYRPILLIQLISSDSIEPFFIIRSAHVTH